MPDRDHSRSLLSELLDGADDAKPVSRNRRQPAPRRTPVLAFVGGLVAFVGLTLCLVLLGRLVSGGGVGGDGGSAAPAPAAVAAPPSAAQPSAPATAERPEPGSIVPGYRLEQHAVRTDGDCAAHSYGRVQEFFRTTTCAELRRTLYTGVAEGVPVVVSVSTVEMSDGDAAAELQDLVDTSGTGNVADLLREGVTLPGGPQGLDGAGYASGRDGASVVIVECAPREADAADGDLLDRTSEAMLPLGR